MRVCGTLVLQYKIAPKFRNSLTISLSKTFSFPVPFFPSNVPIHLKNQPEIPSQIWTRSKSLISSNFRVTIESTYTNISHGCLNTFDMKLILQTDWQSMKRTNRLPMLGIILIQFLSIGNSSIEENLMETSDLSDMSYISVEAPRNQPTNWWASAALWQNASATSRAFHVAVAVFLTIPTASVSVISISLGDRNCWIYLPVTSLCSVADGSGVGNNHSFGIRALIESRFSFASAVQRAIIALTMQWNGQNWWFQVCRSS